MSVLSDIITKTIIKQMVKNSETQSYIAEILKVITPDRARNTLRNVTLVLVSNVGVCGN